MNALKRWSIGLAVTLVALALGACGGVQGNLRGDNPPGSPPPVSHGGSVVDYVSLVDALRGAGLTVEPDAEIEQPFFSIPGRIVLVNGAPVQIFEYPDDLAAEAEAARIQPDGSTVNTMVMWVAPPHFFHSGKLIVLYVGTDDALIESLSDILGAQIAGG